MKFDEYYAKVKQQAPTASLGAIREAYARKYDREPVFEQAPDRDKFRVRVSDAYPDLSFDEIDAKYDEIYKPSAMTGAKLSFQRGGGSVGQTVGSGLQLLQEEYPDSARMFPGFGIAKSIADLLPSGRMIRDYWQKKNETVPKSGYAQNLDVSKDPIGTLTDSAYWAEGAPETLVSQIMPVVGGFLMGGPGGAFLGGALPEGLSTYATAKDKGLEHPVARGAGMGLAAGALNMLPYSRLIPPGIGTMGRVAATAAAEGATEMAEELPGTYLESEVSKWDDPATLQEAWRRAANVGPLAAVGGGATSLFTGGESDQAPKNGDLLDVTSELMKGQEPTTPDNPEPPLPKWAQDLADKGQKPYLPQPGVKKTILPKAEEKRVALETALAPIHSKWKGGPKVNVVASFRDLPEDIRNRFDDSINGAYDGAENVYLIADKFSSWKDAGRVLYHEALGHYSIEQIIPDIDAFAADVSRLAPNDPVLRKYYDEVQSNPGYAKEEPMVKALEVVAKYSEDFPNTKHPLVERLYSRLREFGRNTLRMDLQLNRADLNLALRKAMRNLERGTSQPTARTADGEMKASDYRGLHKAPGREGAAPAHDLTQIYPDDVYGPNGLQYYGTGERGMDLESYSVLQAVRGRPNAKVTIYRAVPYEKTNRQKSAQLQQQMNWYMKRRLLPAGVDMADEVQWYQDTKAEIERLETAEPAGGQRYPITPGDWVTLSRAYAKQHGESALGGKYRIEKKVVRASEIYTNGDSWNEFGYAPEEAADTKIVSKASRPSRNSVGGKIAKSPEAEKNFWKFFDGSKVVTKSGRPLVVYHGTDADFDSFDIGRSSSGIFGRGFYFAAGQEEAEEYASGGKVIPAYLALRNPANRGQMDEILSRVDEDDMDAIRAELEAGGFDGVAIDGELFVALRPEQIKSVDNSGAFSPGDSRFKASRPGHTVKIRKGDETLKKWGIEPGKTYNTRDVARALESRQRETHGTIAPDDRSREAARKIARWMSEEVLHELENGRDKSGVGWYGEKYQAAVDEVAKVFPELRANANDQQMMREARKTLTALIAITSDGQKVLQNFEQAIEIYADWRTSGTFASSRGHNRGASIEANLAELQRLYATRGIEGTHRYLMEEDTVQNLRALARQAGEKLNTAYEGHITLPRAALIFGPKLGAFYANLSGASGYLTMDRWWSRTFNRMRGTLLTKVGGTADRPTDSKGRPIGLARFKAMIGQPEMTDDEALLAIIPYRQSYEAKKFKDGTDVERAANTLYKKAYEELEDAPFNAGDRTFMLNAVGMAQDMLARRGHEVSIADIQAILWYYEKRLYAELGARETADVSYLEAAKKALEKYQSDTGGGRPDLRTGLEGDPAEAGRASRPGAKASRPPYPAVVRTFDDRVRQSIVRAAEFSPEVRDLYLAIAKGQKDRIETQRRGVQSWTQTEKQAAELLASALGFEHVGSLVAAAPGRAFNPEDFSIMKGAILEATEMVEQGVAAVREDRSPANLAMLKAAMDRLAYLQSPYMGGVAEAGRSLNYLRKLAPVTRNVNQLLDAYVRNPDDLIKVADEITKEKDQEAQTNPLAPVQREIVQVEAEKEQIQKELDAAKVEIDRMRQQGQDLQEILARVREMERQVSEMEKRQAELEAKAREIRKTQPEKPKKPRTVAQIVREQYTPTLGDKFKELFYNFILSGPATQGANLLGNSLYATVDEITTQAGLRATGRGSEANARLRALTLGIHTGIRNAKEAWKTEMPVLDSQTKVEAPGQDFHPKAISGAKGRFIRSFGGRALQAEDEFFKGIAYTMELAQIAVRQANGDMQAAEQLMADPSQEMQEEAVAAAQRRTFTSKLGTAGQAILNVKNKVPGAWLIVPFIQTPINLVKRAMDYSPLGLTALPFNTEMRADMRGENGASKQAVAITRQVAGAGLALMVWEMAAAGLITGGGPPDEKEKTLMRQRDGWQPYSVKIGDKWYSYLRFDPLAIPFGIMADLYETHAMVGEKDGKDIALSIANSFVQNLGNKTWLTGLSELAEMINEPERYGENYVSGFLSAWVPNLIGQTTAANDPWLRESRTILDRIKSRIPGQREQLVQKIGISGEPIPNDAATAAGIPLPWKESQGRPVDPLADAMLRLGVIKERPSRKFRGVELTPEEHADWVKMLQQNRWRQLTPIVQSPQFNALPPLMQANQLEKMWDRLGSNDYSQAVFLMQHPEVLDRIRTARRKAG